MSTRDRIVSGARQWIGMPYVWGGESVSEGGFDCSGLIIAAYKAAGIPLSGRPIASQLGRMGEEVSIAHAQPGDVVYFDKPGSTDHVGIYMGNGKMLNAPYSGAKVRVEDVGNATSIRRLIEGEDSGGGTGIVAGVAGAVGGAAAALNPFDNWAQDGAAVAMKVVGVGLAGALVIAGASRTVKG